MLDPILLLPATTLLGVGFLLGKTNKSTAPSKEVITAPIDMSIEELELKLKECIDNVQKEHNTAGDITAAFAEMAAVAGLLHHKQN